MPIFTEGAQGDPDLDTMAPPPPASPPVAPAVPAPTPSVDDTVDAALRQPGTFTGNFLHSVAAAQSAPQNTPVHGYNPLDTLKGTPHEGDDLSIYAGSQNESYTKYLMADQDEQANNRKTLAAAGWPGTVAGVAAGFIDPVMALPIIGEERIGAAAATAIAGAAVSAAATARQQNPTWQEGAENIATGAILGGVLGKAVEHLSIPEMDRAIAAVDEVRPRVNTDGTMAPTEAQPPAIQTAMQGAGAAPVDTRQLEMKGAFGVNKWGVSPNLRIYNSSSLEGRRAMHDLAETGLQFKPEEQVAPLGPPLESLQRYLSNSTNAQADDIIGDAWLQHYYQGKPPGHALPAPAAFFGELGAKDFAKTIPDKLSYSDFDKAIGVAMHNGDEHVIPEVQQAAQQLRSKIVDPITQLAKDTKGPNGQPMLSEDLAAPKGARSFFPLMPDRDKIAADYDGARELFTNYLEREQVEKVGIKGKISEALESGDQASLKDAVSQWKGNAALKSDEEPAVAAQRMLGTETGLSRQELRSRAEEWTNRLIGSPDGRLDYDVQPEGTGFHSDLSDLRGSLKERKMAIEINELINRGYVNTSAAQGIASLTRSIVPDVLLTRRFGDVAMTDTFKKIEEEYAAKAKPGEDTTKLFKERGGVIRDLSAARDRLRGIHGWDQSPLSRTATAITRDFQNFNSIRQLGTSWVVRTTDLTNATFRHGMFTVFDDAAKPLMKSLVNSDFRGMLHEQALDAGLGVDGQLGHMRHILHDVIESQPQNRFSRALALTADRSMLLNLHGPLTDSAKTLSANITQGAIARASKGVVDGTVTAADLEKLAQSNISREMAARISRQYEQHSVEVDGRRFAKLSDWTDQGAKATFAAALQRESGMAVMQAGIGDRPLWLDYKIGRLLGQYKNFCAAAHEKILLANLQQRDARTLQGVLVTLGMGYVATAIYKELSGQPWPKNPAEWTKEAIDRAAMTGWFGEINRSLSGASRGQISYDRLYGAGGPPSRRADVSLSGQFMGPTMDLIQRSVQTSFNAMTSHETKKHGTVSNFGGNDVHNLRLLLPLQNLQGFRILLDKVEGGLDRSVGFKVPKSVSHEEPAEPASKPPKTGQPRSHHAQKPVAATSPQPAPVVPAAPQPQAPQPAPVAPPPQPPPEPPKPRRKHRAVN